MSERYTGINTANAIGSRAVKETTTTENVRLFGLFRCGFHYARTNKYSAAEVTEHWNGFTPQTVLPFVKGGDTRVLLRHCTKRHVWT